MSVVAPPVPPAIATMATVGSLWCGLLSGMVSCLVVFSWIYVEQLFSICKRLAELEEMK